MAISDSWVMPVVAVDDIERATTFYRDKLGLRIRELPPEAGGDESRLVEVGHGYLLLYKSEFRRGETTVATIMVKDFDGTASELRSRGVTFEDYDLPGLKTENGIITMGDTKGAWFKDSEGNVLSLMEESEEIMRLAA